MKATSAAAIARILRIAKHGPCAGRRRRPRRAHGYRLLERLNESTLVEGIVAHRTHATRFRVHFQHLCFPLAGDQTYGQRQRRSSQSLRTMKPRAFYCTRTTGVHTPAQRKTNELHRALAADFEDALSFLRVA